MDYEFVPASLKHNGGPQFCHCISLHLKNNRRSELTEWLEAHAGPKGVAWKYSPPPPQKRQSRDNRHFWSTDPYLQGVQEIVRFVAKDRAMLLKLIWEEDESEWESIRKWMKGLPSIRNVSMTSVRPTAPPIHQISNPLSWYYTQGMISRTHLLDSLGIDDFGIAKKPTHERARIVKHRASMLTTEEVQERIANGIYNFKALDPQDQTSTFQERNQPEDQT
jgi:hypothetical protein